MHTWLTNRFSTTAHFQRLKQHAYRVNAVRNVLEKINSQHNRKNLLELKTILKNSHFVDRIYFFIKIQNCNLIMRLCGKLLSNFKHRLYDFGKSNIECTVSLNFALQNSHQCIDVSTPSNYFPKIVVQKALFLYTCHILCTAGKNVFRVIW